MSYRRRRTIFGGNSEYQGYSKSNRAVEAEEVNSLLENFKNNFPNMKILSFPYNNVSTIEFFNPDDHYLHRYKIDLKKTQTKKEIKNIIKSQYKESEKHFKRHQELIDYVKKIGDTNFLSILVEPERIILYKNNAWDYTIIIDEKTTNSEIKKEIKRILEPYFKKRKMFETLMKKYNFIKKFYYFPYTGYFWIEFTKYFKSKTIDSIQRINIYRGITNGPDDPGNFFKIERDITIEELKKELDSLKKEFKHL